MISVFLVMGNMTNMQVIFSLLFSPSFLFFFLFSLSLFSRSLFNPSLFLSISFSGIKLAKYVRNKYPNLPIIMQSALPQNEPIVAREFTNVAFINKNDPKLLSRVRSFLLGPMGFGMSSFLFLRNDCSFKKFSTLFSL